MSFALLVVFYALILGIAAVLFALPVAMAWVMIKGGPREIRILGFFAVCWIPAGLLMKSLFTTRAARFVPPGRRVGRDEAEALFATIDELAARGATAPPVDVYLNPLPNLAVTETGGFFRSRRVLVLGAPLLRLLTVDELRCGIAHELGHFAGGDTRLTAFTSRTHALFSSVIRATERDPFRIGSQHAAIEGGFAVAHGIGRAILSVYGTLFLRVTMPLSRRQELAADSMSVALVGGDVAARALEKIHVGAPLYLEYLRSDVGFAVTRGAMPSDLAAGYERLRAHIETTEAGRRFIEAVRTQKTDTFDSHPSLLNRLRTLEGSPVCAAPTDDRSAVELFADPHALDAWSVEAIRERIVATAVAEGRTLPRIQTIPWSSIPAQVYAPTVREGARRAAERLHSVLPEASTLGAMFAATWRAIQDGDRMATIALRLDPGLAQLPSPEASRVARRLCAEVLGTLFGGALIERGAVVEESLGEPGLVYRLEGERVAAAELFDRLASNAAEGHAASDVMADRWAARLEKAPTSGATAESNALSASAE